MLKLCLYFYLPCTMDLFEEKGVLHGNCGSCHVLLITCNVSHDDNKKNFKSLFVPLSTFAPKIIKTLVMCECHGKCVFFLHINKTSHNSTFYEGIINNVQQNKGIYK